MEKGKLIVIEGACDGIGKSTQFERLWKALESEGKVVTSHHFPSYNTFHGEPVVRYLKGEFGPVSELSPYFIHGLYAMDRAIAWKNLLGPKYNNGEIILLDRYTTSSQIYQAALIENIDERKRFLDYIEDQEYNKLGVKKPDKVIFLTMPFDLVTKMRMERVDNEGVTNDIHERDMEFMKRVYNNAVFVAQYLNWDIINCNDGEEIKSREEIHEEIIRRIRIK